MNTQIILKDCKLLMRFVIPSMLSMLSAGVYTIVDGLFVGWGAGAGGMAALNVAYPIALFIVAVAEMIGIGGAINISIARGRGALRTAESYLNLMLRIAIPAGIILPLIITPLINPILSLTGGAPELMGDAREYALIIIWGGIFQLVAISLIEAIRNDNAPRQAMMILVGGLVANIILDYIFVILLKLGVAGSAWATIAAQAFCMTLAIRFFITGRSNISLHLRKLRIRKTMIWSMLRSGIPSFGVQISLGVIISLHNFFAQKTGGVDAVAAYAVISYYESTIVLMLQGIALGLQPVASFLHGAGKFAMLKRMAIYAMLIAVATGVAGCIVSIFAGSMIGAMFNAQGAVLAMATSGFFITAFAYPLMGFQKISESFFQSTERTLAAGTLIYLDSCVILPLSLVILPSFMGLSGVWAALPVSKIIIFLAALGMWLRKEQKMENTVDADSRDSILVVRMKKLFDLWGKFDRVYFKLLQKRNLSYNSYLVLEELLENRDGLEPAVLADRLNIPRQTMTFVLDHLEKDGFLSRYPHPADRRRKLIRLSENGLLLAESVSGDILERECRAMKSLTSEEQQTLLELYHKLSSAFEQSFTSPAECER